MNANEYFKELYGEDNNLEVLQILAMTMFAERYHKMKIEETK